VGGQRQLGRQAGSPIVQGFLHISSDTACGSALEDPSYNAQTGKVVERMPLLVTKDHTVILQEGNPRS
jgi:hypothetical protein